MSGAILESDIRAQAVEFEARAARYKASGDATYGCERANNRGKESAFATAAKCIDKIIAASRAPAGVGAPATALRFWPEDIGDAPPTDQPADILKAAADELAELMDGAVYAMLLSCLEGPNVVYSFVLCARGLQAYNLGLCEVMLEGRGYPVRFSGTAPGCCVAYFDAVEFTQALREHFRKSSTLKTVAKVRSLADPSCAKSSRGGDA